MFAGTSIQVIRLALNMSQVEELQPPPNPAKVTDSRYGKYVAEYGDESWELDALPPDYIKRVIENCVLTFRDERRWDAMLKQEVEDKRVIEEMIDQLPPEEDDGDD